MFYIYFPLLSSYIFIHLFSIYLFLYLFLIHLFRSHFVLVIPLIYHSSLLLLLLLLLHFPFISINLQLRSPCFSLVLLPSISFLSFTRHFINTFSFIPLVLHSLSLFLSSFLFNFLFFFIHFHYFFTFFHSCPLHFHSLSLLFFTFFILLSPCSSLTFIISFSLR